MKNDKRRIRQEKMAKLLYELGMDIEVVSNISGIGKEEIKKFKVNKNEKNVCND